MPAVSWVVPDGHDSEHPTHRSVWDKTGRLLRSMR
ncbi:MAG: hypothetical protein DMG80_03650 [Acidobacteria bacterium]|nr:MAG: hypothetical protein DMG80_03650 [Acidobacteriota bacterium]